jgi:hypothetical protein
VALLVLAYPELSERDFDVIQNYRRQNDPLFFNVVKPHFTIIFSTDSLSEQELMDEVADKANDFSKFDFHIRCATINQDDSGSYFHEFLVPDEGNSNIIKLHDVLYSGKLAGELRLDIDFIPHIGIGNSPQAKTARDRVSQLNIEGVDIKGRISYLDVVRYENNMVTTIKRIELS